MNVAVRSTHSTRRCGEAAGASPIPRSSRAFSTTPASVVPRPAHACSCALSVSLSPRDQSTGVARNAALFVSMNASTDVVLTLVRVSDGSQVPITVSGQGADATYVIARPDVMLDANTT